MKIHIDFESRSACDLWKCGVWAYAAHPTTEILCLAYALGDGEVKIIPKDDIIFGCPKDLREAIESGANVHAFNAIFERLMWMHQLESKGWPRIPIKQWRCTMAKALARSLPRSLQECGKALKCSILKDELGKSVMMKLCKPNSKGEWYEGEADFQKLYEYCMNDVEAERAIDKMLPDLIDKEQVVWFLDQLINTRGVYVDTVAINRAIEIASKYSEMRIENIREVTNGQLDGVSRRMAVLQWCQDQGIPITGYTKADVKATLKNELPEEVRMVLETKLELGKTSVQKYEAMSRSVSEKDSRIRDLLIYHGASTGRWAGKLIQLHNLPKGKVKDTDMAIECMKSNSLDDFQWMYPELMETLSSCIRGMIIASPGHELIVADYSAIEARVVMWLAGESYGVKQFEEGADLYVDMAKVIYNTSEISSDQRQLGKAAILGCGYGMGHVKFFTTCASWGIPITEDLAKKAIEAYRSTYVRVRSSWYDQERGAIACVKTGRDQDVGKIRWHMDGDTLLCGLPSGRCIAYNNPQIKIATASWGDSKEALHYMGLVKSQGQTTTKWGLMPTYGGRLVENITQAVARDILAYAMLRCEKAGYKVLFSVHDEIVAEVPEGFGSVKEFEQILCANPSWAQGCPIAAKGWRGRRYKKG